MSTKEALIEWARNDKEEGDFLDIADWSSRTFDELTALSRNGAIESWEVSQNSLILSFGNHFVWSFSACRDLSNGLMGIKQGFLRGLAVKEGDRQ